MKYLVAILFASCLAIHISPANSTDGTITPAQFKRIPGVAISIEEEKIPGFDVLTGMTKVSVYLDSTNGLGMDIKDLVPKSLTVYLLMNDGKKALCRAPLRVSIALSHQAVSAKERFFNRFGDRYEDSLNLVIGLCSTGYARKYYAHNRLI